MFCCAAVYHLAPYKNSEVFDRYIEGLIKAGFKGKPSDYHKVKRENKMIGQEIRELIFGKTMEGTYFTIAWSIAINKDRGTEYSNPILGNHKGKSWIEGDAVCSQCEYLYDGLAYCSEVYKIPEEDKSTSI